MWHWANRLLHLCLRPLAGAWRYKMGFLKLQDVGHSYGSRDVLRNINLTFSEGEFVSIVGTSASGKTTLLKIAAGLVTPSTGAVTMGGNAVKSFSREAAIVFQNYSLLPWL